MRPVRVKKKIQLTKYSLKTTPIILIKTQVRLITYYQVVRSLLVMRAKEKQRTIWFLGKKLLQLKKRIKLLSCSSQGLKYSAKALGTNTWVYELLNEQSNCIRIVLSMSWVVFSTYAKTDSWIQNPNNFFFNLPLHLKIQVRQFFLAILSLIPFLVIPHYLVSHKILSTTSPCLMSKYWQAGCCCNVF